SRPATPPGSTISTRRGSPPLLEEPTCLWIYGSARPPGSQRRSHPMLGPPPPEDPAAPAQLTRGTGRKLIQMVYSGGIASGDLGLLLFSAARQDLLNDLVAPGEGGLDMGIV